MRRKRTLSLFAAMLMLCLNVFPASAAKPAESAAAATMQLMKTEGSVNVTDSSSRSLSMRDNMRLYNGYKVGTETKSYAWVNLDSEKLAKLDAVSEAKVRKSGRKLELLLTSGSIFFNVTSPLEADETLNIRTSTMVIGIRGTSGWVKVLDRWVTEIYILEGTVQISVSDPVTGQVKTAALQGGEKAAAVTYPQDRVGDKCDIIRDDFTVEDIPGFVLAELAQDPGLCGDILEKSGMDVRDAAENAQDRLEQDEQAMQDKLDGIEEAHPASTDPVWKQKKSNTNTSGGSSDGGGDEKSATRGDEQRGEHSQESEKPSQEPPKIGGTDPDIKPVDPGAGGGRGGNSTESSGDSTSESNPSSEGKNSDIAGPGGAGGGKWRPGTSDSEQSGESSDTPDTSDESSDTPGATVKGGEIADPTVSGGITSGGGKKKGNTPDTPDD